MTKASGTLNENGFLQLEKKPVKTLKETEIETANQNMENSTTKLKKIIRGIATTLSTQVQTTEGSPQMTFRRPPTREVTFEDSVIDDSILYTTPGNLIDELKGQLKDREKFLAFKTMVDNREAEKNYINYDLEFQPATVQTKEEVLKAKDYNLSELDNVHQIWRKTSRAIRILEDKQTEHRRASRNPFRFKTEASGTDDPTAVHYLQTANFTSNYDFDDQDFMKALKEDEEDLDEIVRKACEARKKETGSIT